MALTSPEFRGDPALEAASTRNDRHITKGQSGEHVKKIQRALQKVFGATIDPGELASGRYGVSTAAAVLAYKRSRGIVNASYQTQADDIVGIQTIARLDEELAQKKGVAPKPPQPKSAPISLPVLPGWFVTALSLATVSVVPGIGFTAATGTITFSRPNGDSVRAKVGLIGPSVGLSLAPNFGKVLSKIPGFQGLISRFPLLKLLFTENPTGQMPLDLMLKVLRSKNPLLSPSFRAVAEKVLTALSGGAEDFPSTAIGMVFGTRGREVQPNDFAGPCVCFSVGGVVGPGNAGIFALFFGLDRDPASLVLENPLTLVNVTLLDDHAKGFALISAASISAAVPALGAGATIFFGELV